MLTAEHESDTEDWTCPTPASDVELALLTEAITDDDREIARLEQYLEARVAPIREAIDRLKTRREERRQSAYAYLVQVGVKKIALPDVGTWYTTTRRRAEIVDEAAAAQAAVDRGLVVTRPDLAAVKRAAVDDGEVIAGIEVAEVESIAFRRAR